MIRRHLLRCGIATLISILLLLLCRPISAQSAFQEAASCISAKIVAKIQPWAGGIQTAICVLPCRNLAGFDTPAMQQMGQLLQSELARQGAGHISLTTALSTIDLENSSQDLTSLPAADIWIEPLAAYAGSDLILAAKMFFRGGSLTDFVFCASRTSPGEILLFSQPPPIIAGSMLKEVFKSQPLPFHALDFSTNTTPDGILELAFLDGTGVKFFEFRDNTLLMKQSLDLPSVAIDVRDLRGAIWIGLVDGIMNTIAQRSNDSTAFSFTRLDQEWQAVPDSLPFVPLIGSRADVIVGCSWATGRNFFDSASLTALTSGSQTQPHGERLQPSATPSTGWYSAAVMPGTVPQLVHVDRDSGVIVSALNGTAETKLPYKAGDALAVMPSQGVTITSYPTMPGTSGDGLRGIRLADGMTMFEKEIRDFRIDAIRVEESQMVVLLSNQEKVQYLYVYEIATR